MSELQLPPSTDSVPLARRFARRTLRQSGSDVDTVVLLVSEVVTNAVLHARSDIRLVVREASEVVRVEVHDASPVPLRMQSFPLSAGTGRGLRMLDRLARSWGVDPAGVRGKVVWFEVGWPADTTWESFADEVLEGASGDQ